MKPKVPKSVFKKQGGWWELAAAGVAALASQQNAEAANEANAGMNLENRQFAQYEANSARAFEQYEAQQARAWQERMSASNYQRAVEDMKRAGINPMLAYQQGGAGTPGTAKASGMAASAPANIPMQSTSQASINGAIAAATIKQINANTELTEKQAEKVDAEIPYTIAGTGQIKQQTENLKAEMYNIKEKMGEIIAHKDLLIKQGYTQTDLGNLYRAQEQVNKIDAMLKAEQITFTEAQTRLKRVETTLRNLEVPGARNTANWETRMGEEAGAGTKQVKDTVEILRKVLGK